jgi:hypothetical protein
VIFNTHNYNTDMKKFIEFISYHNAVPIALGILFLGSGAAFAASPDVQQAVYASAQVVQSIDNTRIVSADIDAYPFTVQVTGVTEDDTSYYVEYTLQTIKLEGGVWQDFTKGMTLTVAKSLLEGKDLGIYATKELAEVRDSERARLKETQQIEQSIGVSQKVVATVYSGLIGALLDPDTETFPAYTPVIPEVVAGLESPNGAGGGEGGGVDTQPPTITLLGSNPVVMPLNGTYTDLGVLVSDNQSSTNLELRLDGSIVGEVVIPTHLVKTYVVTYLAWDASGNGVEVTRTIEVRAESTTPPPAPDPVPEPTPEPVPEPEPVPDPAPDPVPPTL